MTSNDEPTKENASTEGIALEAPTNLSPINSEGTMVLDEEAATSLVFED